MKPIQLYRPSRRAGIVFGSDLTDLRLNDVFFAGSEVSPARVRAPGQGLPPPCPLLPAGARPRISGVIRRVPLLRDASSIPSRRTTGGLRPTACSRSSITTRGPSLPWLAAHGACSPPSMSVVEIGFIQFTGNLVDWLGQRRPRDLLRRPTAGQLAAMAALVVLVAFPLLALRRLAAPVPDDLRRLSDAGALAGAPLHARPEPRRSSTTSSPAAFRRR